MKKQVFHLQPEQHDQFMAVDPKQESDTPVILEVILCIILFPAFVPVLIFTGLKWLFIKIFN